MGTISRVTLNTGDILTATEWNTQFDTAYNEINGNLDSNNLATDAVTEAKIQDAAVAKDKLGDIPNVIAFSIPTKPAVGTSIRSVMFPWSGTIVKVAYKASTAPSPESLVFDITNNGNTIFNASAASASGTSTVSVDTGLINTSVNANAIFNLDIDAIGTATAGGQPFNVDLYIDVSGSAL